MLKKNTTIFILAATVLMTGCAHTRSEVKLGSPETINTSYPITKSTTILIGSVTDERVFEETPSDPSIPSLGHEGSASASADVKARAFARKRNGFGRALGEVLLKDGQTVSSVVRDNLVTAFRQAGYRTTTNRAEAGTSPMVIEVHVKRFWVWTDISFGAFNHKANIETRLDTSKAPSPITVSAQSEYSVMTGGDSYRVDTIEKALKEYRSQINEKFAKLP